MAPSVLIVDDALFMRMMIKDILRKDGFVIAGEAENGVEAVEKYADLKPDLVTMDIVMPEMDGIEAVRNIIKLDPGAKVLMCSAMGQQPLVVESLEAGARDFIIKPFQPAKVVEAVRKALHGEE
jgi:two-component system chemotaxis response regulator CheY